MTTARVFAETEREREGQKGPAWPKRRGSNSLLSHEWKQGCVEADV